MVANFSFTTVPQPNDERWKTSLSESIDQFNHPETIYCSTSECSETAKGFLSDLCSDYVAEKIKEKANANLGNLLKEEKKRLTHERDQIQRKYPRDNRLTNMYQRLREIDKQLAGMK